MEYLLISGQASVLYGAANFSEDVDLWVRPTAANLGRLSRALAGSRARVYKLTPPLSVRNFKRGHGFHFTLPGGPGPEYLDILGRPPRVGPFEAAMGRARIMTTEWGRLPVVSIEELIALKRTRRLYDYEVISNLVQIRVAESGRPSRRLFAWAARETFRAEDRQEYLRRLGRTASLAECRRRIAAQLQRCQAKDVAYWRPILRELREFRRQGDLLPLGALLRSKKK